MKTYKIGLLAIGISMCPIAATLAQDANPLQTATPEQRYFDWADLDFDPTEYATRRTRLTEKLAASGGGIFLSPAEPGRSRGFTFRQSDEFMYFTGLEIPDAVLVVDSDLGTETVFAPRTDARFFSASRRNDFPGRPLADDPAIAEQTGLSIRSLNELPDLIEEWVAAGRTLRLSVAGAEALPSLETEVVYNWTSVERLLHHLQSSYAKARLQNAFRQVAELRMVKSDAEIAAIRSVVDLTIGAIKHAATFVKPGVSERSLEAELEAAYKRGGAQRLGFSSIIKSGPNALWPWRILAAHYDRRNRTMAAGDLVIFDVGTELDYYVSDVGRTFPISGTFSRVQREKLMLSTRVSDAIIAAIRPGVTFDDLMIVAREQIPDEEQRYMQTGSFFGHHIGMNAGDPAVAGAILSPGMVFTVEPWYYNHDAGISVFVEDVVLVTETGAEVLTAELPRRPDALERLVNSAGN